VHALKTIEDEAGLARFMRKPIHRRVFFRQLTMLSPRAPDLSLPVDRFLAELLGLHPSAAAEYAEPLLDLGCDDGRLLLEADFEDHIRPALEEVMPTGHLQALRLTMARRGKAV
jgi:hypothetical protein